MKRLSALCATLIAITALTAVRAEIKGNSYTSLQHNISFTRPDGSWELRENPAQSHAVALFSNGQGRVIAMLSHRVLEPANVFTSPGNLRTRWPQFVNEIVAMQSTGESGTSMVDADYQASDDGVVFELTYTNRASGMAGQIRNWVSGMMVLDSDSRQHIYALRCAAPSAIYDSWAGQFELLMPTLQFTGQRQVPFYTTAPIPWYWFALGGFVVIVVIAFVRRGKSSEPVYTPRVRIEPSPQTAPQPAPPSAEADAGMVPNVPDQMLVAADLTEATNDIPDQMYHEAALEGKTYDEMPAPAGFWKCECGRMNSADENFCVRCNADRVRA